MDGYPYFIILILIKFRATIFGIRGTFTGWVDSTMSASAIWPLLDSPNYNQITANNNSRQLGWLVRWGYDETSTRATGISTGQRLWSVGFRYLHVTANLYAYDRSGACSGFIYLYQNWWGYVDGAISRYAGYQPNNVAGVTTLPSSGDGFTSSYIGWSIGSGYRSGATANFNWDFPLVRTSGDTTYYLLTSGVYYTIDEVSSTSAGSLKMNSYNMYFKK